MKTWNKPSIEELDVNETAYAFSGSYSDDGFYNGITHEQGWYDDGPSENNKPNNKPSHNNDIIDALS